MCVSVCVCVCPCVCVCVCATLAQIQNAYGLRKFHESGDDDLRDIDSAASMHCVLGCRMHAATREHDIAKLHDFTLICVLPAPADFDADGKERTLGNMSSLAWPLSH